MERSAPERRYERLRLHEIEQLAARAPIAWVPVGTLEHHGPHLPFGVDAFEAHGLLRAAADRAGGVVLPPTYVATGCLDLPFTLSFSPELVERLTRETVERLADRGFRLVVVLTGHGPLDLIHLVKRVCREVAAERDDLAAYGLCWLELNAARLDGPQEGEPRVVDHAALVETSLMLALEPGLVDLDRLDDDPDATHTGVYGRNPRFTADADWGRATIDAAADLLAGRATALLRGEALDDLADLRRFVACSWPEPLEIAEARVDGDVTRLRLRNPGRASRYLSALHAWLDDRPVHPEAVVLRNASPGETGVAITAGTLGAESGFYVRREQTVDVTVLAAPPGPARLRFELGLGGVETAEVAVQLGG